MYSALITLLPLLSFGQQRWEVVFGNPDILEVPLNLTDSYDKGVLICTWNELNQATVFKTDKNGEPLWNKLFDGPSPIGFTSIAVDEIGNIVAVGAHGSNALIVLIDKCGELQWCNELVNEQEYDRTRYTEVIFVNNTILVLGGFYDDEHNSTIHLANFELDGTLLWLKEIVNEKDDPLMRELVPAYFDKIGDSYFVSGFCYYAKPGNPDMFYPRAMFVKIDSLYNKDWFLPYGMEDALTAISRGVIPLDSDNYRGYGTYLIGSTDTSNAIFMDFDAAGIETGHKGIPNNSISPTVKDNDLMALQVIDDSTYFITAQVGEIPLEVNPIGEWTMDTSGYVYAYQNHPGAFSISHPTTKTNEGQFVTVGKKMNETIDILLYKLNADLSQAEFDTSTIVYDSLCDSLPIVSDTIYLDNCSIITGIEEVPTPQEYYAFIKTIPVDVFPNPATTDIVFELGNTGLHKNISLACFDINGKLVFEQTVQPGQTQIKSSVANWKSGMYIAVTSSSTGGTGSAKFVVK